MSDSEKTTSAAAAPEKPRSTAEADITKYKVRVPRPWSLSFYIWILGHSRHRQCRGEKAHRTIRRRRKRIGSVYRR
jgi:hypothetical protein